MQAVFWGRTERIVGVVEERKEPVMTRSSFGTSK